MTTLICRICGVEFLAPAALAHRYSTCGPQCSKARRSIGRGLQVEVACAICGTPVRRFRSHLRGQTTCSDACRLKLLNARPRVPKPMSERQRRTEAKGYVRVSTPEGRLVMEHRWVMEQVLGRRLEPGERVHHVNGVRSDNRPENLRLYRSQAEHLRESHPDLPRVAPHRAHTASQERAGK